MQNETKHTPTPWKSKSGFVYIGSEYLSDKGSKTICRTVKQGGHPEVNAAHIVKCVNAYDEMLEALKGALFALDTVLMTQNSEQFKPLAAYAVEARKAIAKAEGEE